MYAEVKTMCLSILRGQTVDAEIDVGKGIPDFEIVGLGDTSVHESRKRVRNAIINSKIKFPVGRITVNLAPANVKKEGSGFDLAIAIGILTCSGAVPEDRISGMAFIGELSLDGRIRGVKGMLPMLEEGRKRGIVRFMIPAENAEEARYAGIKEVYGAETLSDAVEFLRSGDMKGIIIPNEPEDNGYVTGNAWKGDEDMSDIAGQKRAKRVMEIAASGGHNILLKGSPGCGKTMIARRMATILPPMTMEEALEVTSINSVAGLLENGCGLVRDRPFRQIARTVSPAALTGGGGNFLIGEVSLAHNGILFIDEFAELGTPAGDALRQPLEEKNATFVISGKKYTLPADFMLVAASCPCRCGMLYEEGKCRCTPYQIRNYEKGLRGPLADRIDIHLEVVTVPYEDFEADRGETSEKIRERVTKVREIQRERYKKESFRTNSSLNGKLIDKYCVTEEGCREFLSLIMNRDGFSMRSYEKIMKVARTIADMSGREKISEEDIAEAVQYRPVIRESID